MKSSPEPLEWENKYSNYRDPRRREKERVWEIFEEIIVENLPKMEKEIVNQVQEVQRVPYRIDWRRSMPKHILIKLTNTKHKQRILKVAKEKQVIYKGNPICLTADLSRETLQARREWQDMFKVLKGEKSTTKIVQQGSQNWWRNKKLFR